MTAVNTVSRSSTPIAAAAAVHGRTTPTASTASTTGSPHATAGTHRTGTPKSPTACRVPARSVSFPQADNPNTTASANRVTHTPYSISMGRTLPHQRLFENGIAGRVFEVLRRVGRTPNHGAQVRLDSSASRSKVTFDTSDPVAVTFGPLVRIDHGHEGGPTGR
ncbi:hypothetical protein APR11_001200 [Nocardia amikacinitolerans]|nr:hypothetical protein [Nocardia amikacinitolerans]MCP2294793.1 hypothetical protein [Nocardia amikacinitolerans]